MIQKESFCFLKDGREVFAYKISNSFGEYVTVLDYGASIQEIVVRDREGRLGDVVLGAAPDNLETFTYEGGTIGRCANRIAYGRCTIGGKEYQLEQNMFGHFLHGGSGNYQKKLFRGEILDDTTVVLRYHDIGEGGFDCSVDAAFFFSFDDEKRLTLRLEMTASGTTILNPTNHAYFNLAEDGDGRNHTLWIATDRIVTRREMGLPAGGSRSAAGTPADFTGGRLIREAMEMENTDYFPPDRRMFDEFYLLDGRKNRLAAVLRSPVSGRTMKVYTNMPCLVLFVAEGRAPECGKRGKRYEGYCSVCLETGFVPNAVNCPEYDSPVFEKGQTLQAVTVYEFGVDC